MDSDHVDDDQMFADLKAILIMAVIGISAWMFLIGSIILVVKVLWLYLPLS